jgi:dienelactone hydrolase
MTPSLLLTAALLVPAADPSPADIAKADEMIHTYLKAEVDRLGKNFLDGAKTKAEWEAKRPKLKEQFLDMLGLWPLPEKTPLKATVTGTLERGDVAIEKLHFQSRPGLYVTANLYRPKAVGEGKKLPAILYVCGHSGRGRDGNKTAFQDHGLWFASNGYVCLTVDTLQLGEIPGIHHGTYREGRWWWHDRGYTPAGVECWNGIRAIDYLCSRPDVDPEKIGVTGISGGGATTVWMAAADDRVKVAVPVSGMSDLESYVTNRVINGHCDCMFAYNTYRWEWTTILALFAPKPLLFANSDNDTIFPMDGNRRIITRLRQCYEMLGKPENVDEYISKGGHEDRPDLRVAAFRFMNKHLKGDTGEVKPTPLAPIDGKQLRVFPGGKDLPADAINGKVDEVFVPKAEVKLPEKAEDCKAWKAELVKQLRERSFRPFPEQIPAATNGRFSEVVSAFRSYGTGDTERFDHPEGQTGQEWIRVRWVRHIGGRRTDAPGTLVVMSNLEPAPRWAEKIPRTNPVMDLRPRGGWAQKNPPNTIERSLALLGRTADQGRVWDVAATVGYLAERGKERPWQVVGRGPDGVLAAYAALFEPSIKEVVIVDPPTSHHDGPHFLNVERVLDLPTALGLLAPDVKLTLINAKDPAFDKTATIYKLAGAADKFERK